MRLDGSTRARTHTHARTHTQLTLAPLWTPEQPEWLYFSRIIYENNIICRRDHGAFLVLMSPCRGFNNGVNTGACSDQLVPGAGQGAGTGLNRSREADKDSLPQPAEMPLGEWCVDYGLRGNLCTWRFHFSMCSTLGYKQHGWELLICTLTIHLFPLVMFYSALSSCIVPQSLPPHHYPWAEAKSRSALMCNLADPFLFKPRDQFYRNTRQIV